MQNMGQHANEKDHLEILTIGGGTDTDRHIDTLHHSNAVRGTCCQRLKNFKKPIKRPSPLPKYGHVMTTEKLSI